MTKQEQIKEMVGVMAASNNPFVDVPIEIMPQVAEAIYNAGYRKSEEVRKETAKEILKLIKGIKHIGSLRSELDMIAIEYGVEVEE